MSGIAAAEFCAAGGSTRVSMQCIECCLPCATTCLRDNFQRYSATHCVAPVPMTCCCVLHPDCLAVAAPFTIVISYQRMLPPVPLYCCHCCCMCLMRHSPASSCAAGVTGAAASSCGPPAGLRPSCCRCLRQRRCCWHQSTGRGPAWACLGWQWKGCRCGCKWCCCCLLLFASVVEQMLCEHRQRTCWHALCVVHSTAQLWCMLRCKLCEPAQACLTCTAHAS